MADEFDMKWEAFEAKCKGCNNCGLRAGCTNVVIYRGSRKAPLMIIGEAPGENEDIQGLPFVGRSGQLLLRLYEQRLPYLQYRQVPSAPEQASYS